MCNKEQLVGLLYDELSASERAALQVHLSLCADCRAEIEALRAVRRHLGAWSPPEPQLDIQVVRRAGDRTSRLSWAPAWGLAAAASILLLAGAAAIANLEVRYGDDGFAIRTGWGAAPQTAAADDAAVTPVRVVPAAADAPASEELMRQIAALEQRLRELEEGRPDSVAGRPAAASGLSPGQLTAVRRLVAESESRQRAERARQITQVWSDFNAARSSDYVRVHEALGRVQGLTNYQLKQQRESIDSLYRVSLQK